MVQPEAPCWDLSRSGTLTPLGHEQTQSASIVGTDPTRITGTGSDSTANNSPLTHPTHPTHSPPSHNKTVVLRFIFTRHAATYLRRICVKRETLCDAATLSPIIRLCLPTTGRRLSDDGPPLAAWTVPRGDNARKFHHPTLVPPSCEGLRGR